MFSDGETDESGDYYDDDLYDAEVPKAPLGKRCGGGDEEVVVVVY